MVICRVIEASYIKNYQLKILFDDQKTGIVDLEPVITQDHRPIFRELLDPEKFKNFHVGMDTVVWENGLDLAPEFLYEYLAQ